MMLAGTLAHLVFAAAPAPQGPLVYALIGIVLAGLLLVLLIMLSAIWLRRWLRTHRSRPVELVEDPWYQKPLVPPVQDEPPASR